MRTSVVVVRGDRFTRLVPVGDDCFFLDVEDDRRAEPTGKTVECWQDCALALARLGGSRGPRPLRMFLWFPNWAEIFYDAAYIERLLGRAHDHGWGALVHIVLHPQSYPRNAPKDLERACDEWFQAVMKGRAADVLEVSREPELALLDKPSRQSYDRRMTILDAQPGNVWRFSLAGGLDRTVIRFIKNFAHDPGSDPQDSRIVLAIDKQRAHLQCRLAKEAFERFPSRVGMVATIDAPATVELRGYCEEIRIPVIECDGRFSLRYVLSWLNA